MEKCSHIENPKNIRYLKQFREKFLGSIEGESFLGEEDIESKGHYGLIAQEILETLDNSKTIEYD